jgi:hypothetical protein
MLKTGNHEIASLKAGWKPPTIPEHRYDQKIKLTEKQVVDQNRKSMIAFYGCQTC